MILNKSLIKFEEYQSPYVGVEKANALIKSSVPSYMIRHDGIQKQSVSIIWCKNIIAIRDSYDFFYSTNGKLYSHEMSYADRDMEEYCRKAYGIYHNYHKNGKDGICAIETRRLDNIREAMDGTFFVLKWHQDQDNFWHFMYECLPRLYMLKLVMTKEEVRNVKLAIIGSSLNEYQNELVRGIMGFEPETKTFSRSVLLGKSILVNISNAAYTRKNVLRGMISTIKENLGLTSVGEKRGLELYIVRGNTKNGRNIKNDNEIRAMMESKGFIVFDAGKHTVKEQITMFSNAKIVVGGHGAALSNIGFSESLGVIELHGRDYYSCTTFLVNSLNKGKYINICSEKKEIFGNNYEIDIDKLEKALSVMKLWCNYTTKGGLADVIPR